MAISPPDWSTHWQAFDAASREGLAEDAMIAWLAGQPSAVWHAYVRDYLDIERGEAVARWILRQDACDRATAALILFRLEPGYYLERHRLDEGVRDGAPHPLIPFIIERFHAGSYAASCICEPFVGLAAGVAFYRRVVDHLAALRRTPPFLVPDALIGPFHGATAAFPLEADPFHNPQMWALMHRLGYNGLNRATAPWYADERAAMNRWIGQCGALRMPQLAAYGPDFSTGDERQRYLSGDTIIAGLLAERARAALRQEKRRGGAWPERFRLSALSARVAALWREVPWDEIAAALAAALPLPGSAARFLLAAESRA